MKRHVVASLIVAALSIPLACACGGGESHESATGGASPTPGAGTSPTLPPPGNNPATLRERTREVKTVRSLLEQVVYGLAHRRSKSDSEYFSNGLWHSADTSCWRCNVGPGTAAAVLWRTGTWRRAWFREIAIETFDRALKTHTMPDGSFGPPLAGEPNDGVTTEFFGDELGIAYHELEPTLGRARAAQWRKALVRASTYLRREVGSVYVNGNINLGTALMFKLTADATGDPRWNDEYQRELTFTLRPPPADGLGAGLHVKGVATSATGLVHASGYLAERGAGGIGFDPSYTSVQDDIAARLYAIGPSQQSLRLIDLFTNALLPRVDRTFRLHTYGGTRHGAPDGVIPFTTTALPILAFDGGRTDLVSRAIGQLARIRIEFGNALQFPYGNSYRLVGLESTALIALAAPIPTATGA